MILSLGPFRFELATAAPDRITRTRSFRWAEKRRIGRAPALQFTGKGAESMDLRGRVYPAFAGGLGQVDDMAELAGKGEPMTLIDGTGAVLGQWVIAKVSETRKGLMSNGIPRRIDFTLSLQSYGGDD